MIDAQRVDFIAVPTRDEERALMFCGETLGLRKNPLSTDTWHEFETGNVTLALVEPEKHDIPFAPLRFGAIAIRVPDVAEARRKLEEADVVFNGDVYDSGVRKMAAFADPDGNGILLHRRYAPYADRSTP